MSFLETVEQARVFLERNGRVSLRVLELEFELNDDQTEALVAELVDVQQVAVLEEVRELSGDGPPRPLPLGGAGPRLAARAEARVRAR